MRGTRQIILAVLMAVLLAGCAREPSVQADRPAEPSAPAEQAPSAPADSESQAASGQAEAVGREEALAIAMENAGVPGADAYNIKAEKDEESGIPIYDIEFETDYGDYDFEVAVADGAIVGADYEVDEAWLDTLGGSPVTEAEAAALVCGKVPGAAEEDVRIWEEQDDGRSRYEGELFCNSVKYEFEIDPQTGRIYDWNADLRE